jgi:hypothetical protein
MKKKKPRIPKAVIKRQTGEFQRTQTFRLEMPLQFLMLCKLVNTTPQQLITDFMENMAFGSWRREGREHARQHLATYFIEHGYGHEQYSADELKLMFAELDAMAMLFPKNGETDTLEAYSTWREKQQEYWFNRWLR